jgi:hypothetical protein
MERKQNRQLVLKLNDREECNYIIYGLSKLPQLTQNVNETKLNMLIANIEVVKASLDKQH